MADNIELNSGSGGATLAADDISSVWYQIVKMAYGALNTATLVTTSNPLPVDIRAENASVTVDNGGTFVVQEDGAALTALQLIDDPVVVLGTAIYIEATTKGNVIGVVRNDTLAALADTDNEIAPLQVNASGALYIQEGSALDVSAATVTVDLAGNNDVTIDDSSIVLAEDDAHSSGDAGIQMLAVRKATPADLSGADGDYEPLQLDNGRLWVSAIIDAALPAGTNAIGKLAANSGVDIGDVDVLSIAAGDNNIGNVDIVTVLTGSGALNLGKIEDGPHSGGDLGVMALAIRDDALTANAGVGADLDYLPLRTNNDGALWAQLSAGNLGGCKMFNDIDLDEADIDVATGACTVYAMYAVNTTASILHLKLFNTNTVTMGTTNADASIPIPANADSDGAGFVIPIPACGVAFSTALTVAVTTAAALDDNGAPGAGAAMVTIFYQD